MIFDAIGRLAIGQNPGSFALNASGGTFLETGSAATFRVSEGAASGSYALTGGTTTFNITEATTGGSYVLSGFNANEIVFLVEVALGGSYVLTGFDTGYYRDFVNWFPATEPKASSWQGISAHPPVWTNTTIRISNWTVDPDMIIPPPELV